MTVATMSVWWQPERSAAAHLEALIARLAAVHNTATFPAHVTMVGPFQDDVATAVTRLGRLVDRLTAPEIDFPKLACEPAWQRSVYLKALATPELTDAQAHGIRTYSLSGQPAFTPHLSLQYSDLPLAAKQRLAEAVTLPLPVRYRFDRLSLWHTAGTDARRWRMIAAGALAPG